MCKCYLLYNRQAYSYVPSCREFLLVSCDPCNYGFWFCEHLIVINHSSTNRKLMSVVLLIFFVAFLFRVQEPRREHNLSWRRQSVQMTVSSPLLQQCTYFHVLFRAATISCVLSPEHRYRIFKVFFDSISLTAIVH